VHPPKPVPFWKIAEYTTPTTQLCSSLTLRAISMNRYLLTLLFLSASAHAEQITLLCEEESKILNPKFAEQLVIDLEAGTIQSSFTIPGSLEITSQSDQYITALNIFEEHAGGIIMVLDRISGIYIWTRSAPTRMLKTDEYTLNNSSYRGKCISPKPLL